MSRFKQDPTDVNIIILKGVLQLTLLWTVYIMLK